MKHEGKLSITFRGPETRASVADYPAGAEWLGINFNLGAFYSHLPLTGLRDRNDLTLPNATSRSFYIDGSVWDFPRYEDADAFIDRLVREELLAFDPLVGAVLDGRGRDLSPRSVQSRFLRATGITQVTVKQIERATEAVAMLERGVSIADTIFEAGYFDQAHLTRSLKRFTGRTPGEIARSSLALV
jgi:AraC-like DNA-binding protein